MKIPATALMLVCCVALMTDSLAQLIEKPRPEFPSSERGREGWVVLNSSINDDGIVVDLSIKDSSGSDAFNEAALSAVRAWRFESAESRQLDVLLNFVFEQSQVHFSRKFIAHAERVHKLIDKGKLDDAQELIDTFRDEQNIGAYELSYSLIAEGRLAEVRGDKAAQLRCFRRATINHGRWLERDKYLMLLHAMIVLEVQQQDFTSALGNYALLTETSPGRKLAEGLEEPMQSITALLESGGDFASAYTVADIEMTIEHEGSVLQQDIGFRDDYFGETEEIDVRPD